MVVIVTSFAGPESWLKIPLSLSIKSGSSESFFRGGPLEAGVRFLSGCLEDQPVSKWLIFMVIVSPLRIGLWHPFQMAVSWLINGGDPNYLPVLG